MRYATILQPGQIWQSSDITELSRIIVDIFKTSLLYRLKSRSEQSGPIRVTRSDFRRWITHAGAILIGQADDSQAKVSPSAELGKRIVALRKAANLTQQQVATALDVSRAAVAFWETGREGSVNKYLPALANLLNVNVEVLLSSQVECGIEIEVTQDEADVLALYRRLTTNRKLHAQKWLERQASPLNTGDE